MRRRQSLSFVKALSLVMLSRCTCFSFTCFSFTCFSLGMGLGR
jgi:hypothetical protein